MIVFEGSQDQLVKASCIDTWRTFNNGEQYGAFEAALSRQVALSMLEGFPRLISVDGGGIRGYSELIMIESIMKRAQLLLKLSDMPLPADHFDLIAGTSAGGYMFCRYPTMDISNNSSIDSSP